MKRVVFAYSGSPAATQALASVVAGRTEASTLTLDVGQGHDLEEVRERALATGACRAHVLDVRDELGREYVVPLLRAGALGVDLPGTVRGLILPILARKLVEIAAIEGVDTIAHAAADGLTKVGLERLVGHLNPGLTVLARTPQRGRLGSAPVLPSGWGIDVNLLGRTTAGDAVSIQPPAPLVYSLTKDPAAAPDRPAFVDVAFDRGTPVAVNDVAMSLTELLESLTVIAGQHGIGRGASSDGDGAGHTRRGLVESPAGAVLDAAYATMGARLLAPEQRRLRSVLADAYARSMADGLWFTPERMALAASLASLQDALTGVVRVKLFKGEMTVEGQSLASPVLAGQS